MNTTLRLGHEFTNLNVSFGDDNSMYPEVISRDYELSDVEVDARFENIVGDVKEYLGAVAMTGGKENTEKRLLGDAGDQTSSRHSLPVRSLASPIANYISWKTWIWAPSELRRSARSS